MTAHNPRLAAVTVYQWRLNSMRPWIYVTYAFDSASRDLLAAVGIAGQGRAWEFRNKSVAELRREGWIR